jgi:hypothetical protein
MTQCTLAVKDGRSEKGYEAKASSVLAPTEQRLRNNSTPYSVEAELAKACAS